MSDTVTLDDFINWLCSKPECRTILSIDAVRSVFKYIGSSLNSVYNQNSDQTISV